MKNLDKHKFIVNVSVIIKYKGDFVVMKRSMKEDKNPGKYGIPGGKMDHTDENLIEAVKRETKEEIGAEIHAIQTFRDHTHNSTDGWKLYVVYLADTFTNVFSIDKKEVESVQILTKEEISNMKEEDFTPNTRELLLKA